MTSDTSTATTTDAASAVAAYLEAWNEPDAAKRAPLIAAVWAEDGRLVDPPFEAEGHDAIVAAMGGAHEQYPGYRFRQASQVDTHHDQFRYAWELVAPDGAVALAGIDVGTLAPDGRLQRVTGFWGDPEPLG
jgi:hypothetical protein